MSLLSYELFIFNNSFSHLSVDNEETLSFVRSFNNFLPQRNQGIEFEVKDNKLTQRVIDSIDLRSIDNKWNIDFKPRQILLSYNHQNYDEEYCLDNFCNDVLQLISEISKEISFEKSIRMGFVKHSIEDIKPTDTENGWGFLKEKNPTDELVEKTIRFTLRKPSLNLNEPLNYVKSETYSPSAKIESLKKDDIVNFSGIYMVDDINTLTSNLAPRFGVKQIELFLQEIKTILG